MHYLTSCSQGCLSKEEIERMVNDAEKFKEDDDKQKDWEVAYRPWRMKQIRPSPKLHGAARHTVAGEAQGGV